MHVPGPEHPAWHFPEPRILEHGLDQEAPQAAPALLAGFSQYAPVDRQRAAEYAALKARSAGLHRNDRELYGAAKREFVDGVLGGSPPD